MRSAWRVCATLLLSTALFAQTSTPSKPKKAKAAALTAADVQALRDAIAAQQAALAEQQKEIQELREELHGKDQAVQQAQSAATDAATKADAAQAQTAQQQQTVTAIKSDVADLKTGMSSTVQTLQETQKQISEPPTTIHFRGITLTPGGFLAAESVRRSRALGSDINTPFNSVPLPYSSQAYESEFFGSGRQSRISMLAEGKLKNARLSGYYEADFLSAGVTSNNNESNSYTLRQRQVWGQAAFDNGWSFTGGQQWSLVTETKHGLDNRTEALPMTIDPQYHVGFSWTRQYGARLVKNFDNKVWFGVSAENAQATLTSHNNAANFLVGTAGVTGGLYDNQSNYSFNPSPDFIAKLAFEPGFGHYEVFGIYSRFRDRVYPCGEIATGGTCDGQTVASALGAYDSSKNGGGIGVNMRWSFINKHLDFGVHGLTGEGIGRYGSAGLSDTAVHPDGSLALIRSYQGLATLEWHGPKIDIYLNAGSEYAGRQAYIDPISGKAVGYGNPLFSAASCYTEVPPGSGGFSPGSVSSCFGDTRAISEGTIGFWYRLYNGTKGRVQFGPQFSYVNRATWAGEVSSATCPNGCEPHGIDGMIFTSFRYYLP
ncbi:MAG TPA: hypothetical protein VMX38_13815 [Verrucomicrobiae bacterium]|jgi:hypothetical protein|nr:hypothetical protein [Verrucomicrobiae bacterium]